MSNSSLVTYKHIVKSKSKGRGKFTLQKIFVHHMAGNLTVKQCGSVFDSREASAHYGINGKNIGQYVDEADTAWHCGNFSWNQRSIGIELANDGGSSTNWHVSDTTINTAIKLIADICKRNNIKKLNYTGDMTGNLCMHKWVCSTACPGPYLSKQFERIAKGVNEMLTPYYPSTPYTGGIPNATVKKGSTGTNVKHLQNFLNWCINAKLAVDGDCGNNTDKAIRAWQTQYSKEYGIAVDGVFGNKSIASAKQIVAKYAPAPIPTDPLEKWYEALKAQYEWSKNSTYKWVNPPTIENSKTKCTCIALPACALQRLGIFETGQWFYLSLDTGKINGNAADYVKAHPEIFEIIYPNKTIAQLGDSIKKGDIVAYTGTRGHIMVYKGMVNGKPIFDTMGNKNNHPIGININVPTYADRKINMIVRLKKVTR